jgi:hypothetical protein
MRFIKQFLAGSVWWDDGVLGGLVGEFALARLFVIPFSFGSLECYKCLWVGVDFMVNLTMISARDFNE